MPLSHRNLALKSYFKFKMYKIWKIYKGITFSIRCLFFLSIVSFQRFCMIPLIKKKMCFITKQQLYTTIAPQFLPEIMILILKIIKYGKTSKNVVSKTCLFCLSDISLQRYDFANFGLIKKNIFHKEGSCTLWP